MRQASRVLLLLILYFLKASPEGLGQGQPLIPLIDRDLLLSNPEITIAHLSPDGQWVAFLRNAKNSTNVWVKNVAEPLNNARQITASEEAIHDFSWSLDSRYILFQQKSWDSQNSTVYAVDLQDSSSTGIPLVKNLTPSDSVSSLLLGPSRKDSDLVWIGMNKRDSKAFDLYTLSLRTGTLSMKRENREGFDRWIWDWEDIPRLGIRRNPSKGIQEMVRLENGSGSTPVFECSELDIFHALDFDSTNQWIFLVTNKGENQDLTQIAALNVRTLEWKEVEQDPLGKVDVQEVLFSTGTHQPILSTYTQDISRYYWKDSSFQADHNFLEQKFAGRQIRWLEGSADDQRWLISASDADKLSQLWVFDRTSHQVLFQYLPAESLKPYESLFSRTEPYSFQSSDGLTINGYLTVPKGLPSKNLPLVVIPHAEAWEREYLRLDLLVQWLANRGYAVLKVNARGSIGFGKKFLNAGNRQWGNLMQDDLTWGVNDLVGKGIVDSKRVAMVGSGYGAYAVFNGLVTTPDVYAAAVALNGPADLKKVLEAHEVGWLGDRTWRQLRIADSTTAAGRKALRRQSPIYLDTAITASLLLVEAANHPLSDRKDNSRIVATLRDRGKKVEYLRTPYDINPFLAGENRLAVFARVEVFLAKTLKGRSQDRMRADIAQHLKEFTVDVAAVTVGLPVPVVPLSEFPKLASDLGPGNYNYLISVQLTGRKVTLGMNRTVVGDSANWIVTDKITGQTGDQLDEATYQRGTLVPVSRRTVQRSKVSDFSFTPKQIVFSKSDSSVSNEVNGAYFHDGAGMDLLVGRLPLQDGYVTGVYLVGDDGAPKLYQIKVEGRDTVNGELCFRVDLTNAENTAIYTKLWISPTQHMAYRMEIPLASLQGSRMTIELRQQPALPKFLFFLWVITPVHGI